MTARFFALSACVVAAGLAGCAAQPSTATAPAYEREMKDGRPGILGDLTWTFDLGGKKEAAPAAAAPAPATPQAASVAEQEEFKKWREAAGATERQEFEDWRAWQEWKKKNPK